MVLTGNSMGIAVKFGINTTSVVLEMVNFTRLRLVKFIPISNTTLVVFIPNFTATHAITSTYYTTGSSYCLYYSPIFLGYPIGICTWLYVNNNNHNNLKLLAKS